MSKETNQNVKILIGGGREALQTPGPIRPEREPFGILTPTLEPPAHMEVDQMLIHIRDLRLNPMFIIEQPTPISCPTAAKRDALFCEVAREYGVENQQAVHVRMKEEDFRLAAACGFKRVHLYGNSSDTAEANGHSRPIPEILSEFHKIAGIAGELGVTHLRGSLEQATETRIDRTIEFIKGVLDINKFYRNIFNRNVVTDLGLPDTNGIAEPYQYINLLFNILPLLKESQLRLSVHLHDDSGFALRNARAITDFVTDNGISMLLEVSDPRYPGERTGTRPTYNDLCSFGLPFVPYSARGIVAGPTWLETEDDLDNKDKREDASHLHVAGVHTYRKEAYANGKKAYPHSGVYGIMGQGNLLFLMDKRNLGYQRKDKVIKAAALVAREFAAQYGNQKQAYAIAYVDFVDSNSDFIEQLALGFGDPMEWVYNSKPDLSELQERLDESVTKSDVNRIIL